jgi:hypothetical protein
MLAALVSEIIPSLTALDYTSPSKRPPHFGPSHRNLVGILPFLDRNMSSTHYVSFQDQNEPRRLKAAPYERKPNYYKFLTDVCASQDSDLPVQANSRQVLGLWRPHRHKFQICLCADRTLALQSFKGLLLLETPVLTPILLTPLTFLLQLYWYYEHGGFVNIFVTTATKVLYVSVGSHEIYGSHSRVKWIELTFLHVLRSLLM